MDDDGSTMSKPASPPSSEPATGEPPGVRAQLGATIEAGRRLFRAHVELAKTELGEIVGEVKRMVALGALALGALLMVALLLTIGGLLFLGEWLFGSIGWGVLLGTLLLLDVVSYLAGAPVDFDAHRVDFACSRRKAKDIPWRFEVQDALGAGIGCMDAVLVDLDEDGALDVAVANGHTDDVTILFATGR